MIMSFMNCPFLRIGWSEVKPAENDHVIYELSLFEKKNPFVKTLFIPKKAIFAPKTNPKFLTMRPIMIQWQKIHFWGGGAILIFLHSECSIYMCVCPNIA